MGGGVNLQVVAPYSGSLDGSCEGAMLDVVPARHQGRVVVGQLAQVCTRQRELPCTEQEEWRRENRKGKKKRMR